MKSGTGRNGTNPDFPEQPSIASLFPPNKSDTDASSEYNQIPPNFSDHNSLFPANKSDTDVSSEQNQIPPNFSHHNSNSIVSMFPPARSQTDEIIIPNPTITSTSFSHVFPSSIGPTTIQISIPSLFPPTVSETEIDGSACSESNEAHPRVSDSRASIFPPVRSPSNGSEIYETTLDHFIASDFPADSFVFQQFMRSLSLLNFRPQGGTDPSNAMEEILKALKDDNNNTTIVGVHGMGGVGKTTMVKQVAEKVMTEGLFHRVLMATVSQAVNIKEIQSSIADGLELLLKKKSDEGRAKELREKIMADKRILVILDDVWEWIDRASIGIPIGSDLEVCKSKILLTTRREHVCNSMGCKENRIHLNILSPEDSWDLFIKTAGTVFDSTEFEAVAREVAGECQGLPLALVTVARMLVDKDEEEWKRAARRLIRSVSPNPDHQEKVAESIKLSYDFLKDREAKACFLMCSLFPAGHNISKDVLARYGMGLRLFHNVDTLDEARQDADNFTNNLIDSGLLLECDEDGFIKMHDVVHDTAKSISSSGNEENFMALAGSALEEWPWRDTRFESYTAVSVMFNDIKSLPDEPVGPKLQALLLQENKNLREIPSGFFNRMNTLKVLDISGLPILSLPPSIRHLENLCTLYMDRCKSKDISILGGLKKLEILSLQKSLINTFPQELAELTKLRMLDMTSCAHIQTISPKIISRLQRLEELYLQGSFCHWGDRVEGTSEERNASLEEVMNLPLLSILKIDIEDVNCLPCNVKSIPQWQKFEICVNRSPLNRPTNMNLCRLKRVQTRTLFIDTTMSTLPDWFIKAVAKKAEMLIYSWCWNLTNILVEYDKGRLFGLKSLYVEQCHSEQCLIPLAADGISNNPVFENLQELHVHDMESMKEICVGQLQAGSFEKLKFLEVQQCGNLENSLLHSNIIQRLNHLETLKVTENSIKEVDLMDYRRDTVTWKD